MEKEIDLVQVQRKIKMIKEHLEIISNVVKICLERLGHIEELCKDNKIKN